jgi:flavin-dependent dehydrogenase
MHPAVVAGGGLAGAAVACRLAQAGRKVLLLERDATPADKICGEFISTEAQADLARLGLDLAAFGARRITRLRLARGETVVETALPFVGLGLSRRTLDDAVLRLAAASGAELRRGVTVCHVAQGAPLAVEIAGLGTIRAAALFLATGKHDVRGARRTPARPPEALVGFKTYVQLDRAQQQALAGHVDVVLFPDGYAGLLTVEDGRCNLTLLVDQTRLRRAGGTWAGLLDDLCRNEPHLAARLHGATFPAAPPIAISRVPYGFVHRASESDPLGLFRLGDQMGVIPSFTGDGMAIALYSARIAASCHLAGKPAREYHQRMRHDIGGQIGRACMLYRLGRWAPGQALLMRLAAAWPHGLSVAASMTRLPRRALVA